VRRGAHAVLEVRDHLLLAVRARREGLMRAGRRREAPGRVRPGEQAHLDARFGRDPSELVQLGVGLEEHARSLRDAVHAHVEALRLLEHRLEAARSFGRRDLDAVLGAVGEALGGIGQLVEVAPRQPETCEEVPNRGHKRV